MAETERILKKEMFSLISSRSTVLIGINCMHRADYISYLYMCQVH
jgi:hypothetical protein